MRALTLGLATILAAAPLSPAQAIDRSGMQSAKSVRIVSGQGGDGHNKKHHRRDRRGDIFVGNWGYDDWDGGRAWESNSYNDWWHDRPDRAFPRWVQNNQDCERVWSNGTGWRC